jgi:predicted transcriptional regulator
MERHSVEVSLEVKEKLERLAARAKHSLTVFCSRVLIDYAARAATPSATVSPRSRRAQGQPRMETIKVKLPDAVHAKIDTLALHAGVSFGAYCTDVFERHLTGRRR